MEKGPHYRNIWPEYLKKMLAWTFGGQKAGGEGPFSPTTVVSGVELRVSWLQVPLPHFPFSLVQNRDTWRTPGTYLSAPPLTITAMLSLVGTVFAQSVQSYLYVCEFWADHLVLDNLVGLMLEEDYFCCWQCYFLVACRFCLVLSMALWDFSLPYSLSIGAVPALVLSRWPYCCGSMGRILHEHAKLPSGSSSWR